MKVLFISANTERVNMPTMPLGLACVAEATQKAGHTISVLDLMYESNITQSLKERILYFQPECIGISVRNIDDQSSHNPQFLLHKVKDVVDICRDYSSAPIILGGAGYSIYPKSALNYLNADYGIQGEGEITFPLLLHALQNNMDTSHIPGLFTNGNTTTIPMNWCDCLDALSLPEPDILSVSNDNPRDQWITVQTRRGCPLHCIYCSTPAIEGNVLRMRSPTAVVNWLKSWSQRGYAKYYFADNTFNIPSQYAKDICREIVNLGLDISWRCIIYPKAIDNELAALMALAGCKQISLGYESGSERMLRNLKKEYTLSEVKSASQIFADNGIECAGFLMLGGPGETKESVEESLNFSDSLNLDMLKITIGIRIYPNTDLAKIAVEEGMISSDCDLLTPRFYIAKGLERWIPARVSEWQKTHANVLN